VDLLRGVERHYGDTLREHGATPRGADWESLAAQQMRFVQLLRVCGAEQSFSLNDLGCGYGALLDLLADRYSGRAIDYLGIDLSAPMVAAARRLWRGRDDVRFAQGTACPRVADYSVASGIFNVKLDQPIDAWERYVGDTLRGLLDASRLGFAVNFLLPPAPGAPAVPQLYCTLPEPWLVFCRDTLGAQAALAPDYAMREFTLLVRPG
jgi:SAM-dependent methyltransferase